MITDRLIDRVIELQNPSVVGLDPNPAFIPRHIMKKHTKKHTNTQAAIALAVYEFNVSLMDALAGIVPAVKPQIAFYEQFGAEGISCYIETIKYAKQLGYFVIGDIKRGDIASTAKAYSDAHIGRVIFYGEEKPVYDADFITLNPYLGYDSVKPFLDNAREYDKGLFILVKTSNPGAGDIQDVDTINGKVYEIVADKIPGMAQGSKMVRTVYIFETPMLCPPSR